MKNVWTSADFFFQFNVAISLTIETKTKLDFPAVTSEYFPCGLCPAAVLWAFLGWKNGMEDLRKRKESCSGLGSSRAWQDTLECWFKKKKLKWRKEKKCWHFGSSNLKSSQNNALVPSDQSAGSVLALFCTMLVCRFVAVYDTFFLSVCNLNAYRESKLESEITDIFSDSGIKKALKTCTIHWQPRHGNYTDDDEYLMRQSTRSFATRELWRQRPGRVRRVWIRADKRLRSTGVRMVCWGHR